MFRIVPQLTVEDVQRSLDFYTKRLGFEATVMDPPEDPVFAALEREDASLFLVSETSQEEETSLEEEAGGEEEVQRGDPATKKRGVGVRLYLEVDDAEVVYDTLKEEGVAILREIAYNEKENYTEFSLLDPDGYEIGVYS